MSDSLIYHYCSLQGLYAIVKSKALRLSNIFYLNDGLESRWFREQIATEIDRRLPALSGKVHTFLTGLRSRIVAPGISLTYCACFSQNGDMLSQWRSYADDGKGVAVGFDRAYLQRLCDSRSWNDLSIVDVKYALDAKVYLDEYLRDFSVTDSMSESEASSRPGIFDQRHFWGVASKYKNPAFSEEQEVRLIHEPTLSPNDGELIRADATSPVDFHIKHDRVTPFVTLPMHDDSTHPFREVVLGPKNQIRENGLSIRMLFEANGVSLSKHQIRVSTASYR